MKKIIQKLSALSIFLSLGLGEALAVCPDPAEPNKVCDPLGGATFQGILSKFTDFAILVSIPIVSIMVLYGAFLMVTSLGDEGKFMTGKKVIQYAVVGFVVVLLAGGVSTIIQDLLGPSVD